MYYLLVDVTDFAEQLVNELNLFFVLKLYLGQVLLDPRAETHIGLLEHMDLIKSFFGFLETRCEAVHCRINALL